MVCHLEKRLISLVFLLMTCMLTVPSEASDTCKSLFDSHQYEKALKPCINVNDTFKVGFIYKKLGQCEKSVEWYEKSKSATAFNNAALGLIFDDKCKKDLKRADEFLERSMLIRPSVTNHYLKGMLIKEINGISIIDAPNKDAYQFFLKAMFINTDTDSDYEKQMVEDTLREIKSYVKKHPQEIPSLFAKLNDLQSHKVFVDFLVGEVSDMARENPDSFPEIKAFIEREMLAGNVEALMAKAYFLAQGVGYIEDTVEAYRLYLIASSSGNKKATRMKNRLSEKLSSEQRSKAQCLAKKGLTINTIDRWMC